MKIFAIDNNNVLYPRSNELFFQYRNKYFLCSKREKEQEPSALGGIKQARFPMCSFRVIPRRLWCLRVTVKARIEC